MDKFIIGDYIQHNKPFWMCTLRILGDDTNMNGWKLLSIVALVGIGAFVLLAISSPSSEAGMPSPSATYVDYAVFNCSNCHPENWDGWAITGHAIAWPDLQGSSYKPDYCEPCHTTGAGKPIIYPATGFNTSTNMPAYLENVTCQACHGPASEHQASGPSQKKATIGLVMNASLCGSCHYSPEGLGSTHHPTYNEWELSGHNSSATLQPFVKQPSCSNCHEAWNAMMYLTTGVERDVLRETGEDAPITWELACATCHDPHSDANPYQLRVPASEICGKCHNSEGAIPGEVPHHPQSEVRNNTAGYGISRTGLDYMQDVVCADCHMGNNLAGLPNHTFVPNPASCVVCHSGDLFPNVTAAQEFIDQVKADTNGMINRVTPLVDEALALLAQMAGNRTTQNLSNWQHEYDIASFNLESIVSDKSAGNHNPNLAEALLTDAEARASEIIAKLTPPAKITDIVVTDEGDGSIRVNWTASTASDFAKYRIYVLTASKTNITEDNWTAEITNKSTTSYLIEDLTIGATYYVYVTAVDSDGNEITNTVTSVSITPTIETGEGGGGIDAMTLGLIGVVLAIIVIAAVLILMRKKKGGAAKAEEQPEEKKE